MRDSHPRCLSTLGQCDCRLEKSERSEAAAEKLQAEDHGNLEKGGPQLLVNNARPETKIRGKSKEQIDKICKY